jgi:hypothetical protein
MLPERKALGGPVRAWNDGALSETPQTPPPILRARSFYDSLPEIVTVWRGCERGRERGLFWTTNRMTARRFAGNNAQPTLVKARIPKHHILAVFVDNEEDEIVLYPKALPRRIEPHPPLYLVRPDHSIEEIWQEMMIRG